MPAATEVEPKEKKHRVEDALSAARAAIDEGIVCGGAIAMLQSAIALEKADMTNLSDDEKIGFNMCISTPDLTASSLISFQSADVTIITTGLFFALADLILRVNSMPSMFGIRQSTK
jgi:hypothetical protein